MTQKVTFQYFKPSGKYYAEGEMVVDDSQPMFRIFEMAHNLVNRRRCPGLIDNHSQFYAVVEAPGHEHDHPALIIPDEWQHEWEER